MVNYRMVAVVGLAAGIHALPLNINLGAYSPALVVGDGEISFGGRQDVTSLMNVLEGAAVSAAAGVAQAPAQAQAPQAAAQAPTATIPGAPAAGNQIQEGVSAPSHMSGTPQGLTWLTGTGTADCSSTRNGQGDRSKS